MLRITTVAVTAAALLLSACVAQAKLPFTDDFSQGLDPKVWKVSGGNWTVENGELVARNSDRATGKIDPLTGFPYGTFDYVVALGVGTNMILQVDATPLALSVEVDENGRKTKGDFARIGLMVHSTGAAQFADKKWMLLWGWMDTRNSFGLSLLEEAVAWRQGNEEVRLEMGKTYTFKMEVKGAHVKGKVWPKGEPEPDWQVEDDFQGQLTASGVGLLGVGVDVRYDNFSAQPIPGTKATVTGTVYDAKTGKPVAGATVTNGEVTTTTKSNGTYTLSVVAGLQEILASKEGYIPTATAQPVDVGEGGYVSDADIELRPEQLPLSDDFNGGPKLAWEFPATGDFNGDWSAEKDAFYARNVDKIGEPTASGLPSQGLWDYAFVRDVAVDLILTAKVTPLAFGTAGFSRVGIATHVSGSGGSGDKKWMLLYGVLDVESNAPFGLALLEEGLAWRDRRTDIKLDVGKTYIFKMAVKGTDVKGKVWEDGTPEPGWQVSDTFTLNQIYEAGIALLGVGADVKYDDVQAVPYVEEAPPVLVGDVNGDGKVGIPDATIALQIAVGIIKDPTPQQIQAGDLNKNGKVEIAEVTRILRTAVGLDKLG